MALIGPVWVRSKMGGPEAEDDPIRVAQARRMGGRGFHASRIPGFLRKLCQIQPEVGMRVPLEPGPSPATPHLRVPDRR